MRVHIKHHDGGEEWLEASRIVRGAESTSVEIYMLAHPGGIGRMHLYGPRRTKSVTIASPDGRWLETVVIWEKPEEPIDTTKGRVDGMGLV